MISVDQPIKQEGQDRLHRYPLAQAVAGLITNYDDKSKESFVIGVNGAWGTGKTSFINLIRNQLGGNVIQVTFNPWLFSDQSSLFKSFFAALMQALKSYVGPDILGSIASYSKSVASVDTTSLGIYGLVIQVIAWFMSQCADTSLDGQRHRINTALAKLDQKILVVIDDIDRLDSEETRLIFKLIKASANFRNTIFLIAYDRVRVGQQLTDPVTGFDGNEYLKKIVQVDFLLPVPEPDDLYDLFIADLNRILKEVYGNDDVDNARWAEFFRSGYSSLFTTIRDINAYINSLSLDWSILKENKLENDIDKIDFIGIEAIRVFAPEFYSLIAGHRNLFTASELFIGLRGQDGVKAREAQYKELLKKVPETIREYVDTLCHQLFPQLGNIRHGSDFETKWKKEKRICSEERFHFYFKLTIPRGAISDVEFKALLKTLGNESSFYQNLKRYDEEKRLRQVLNNLVDYLDGLDRKYVQNLIRALWRAQDASKDAQTNVWQFDDLDSSSMRLAYHAVKENIPEAEREAFLAELFRTTTHLYPMSRLARLVIDEHSKKGSGNALLPNVEEVKKVCLAKMEESAKKDLDKVSHLPYVLYGWRDYGGEQEMKEYVSKLISTKKGLLRFLASTIHLVLSSTGNYEEVSREELKGLCSLEDLDKAVAAITDADLKRATKKERRAVDLFRNPPRSPWAMND